MRYRFDNKVAIITGSSRGIGRAVAFALAQQGCKVVLNGRDEAKLEETHNEFVLQGFNCRAYAGDISDFNFCQSLIDRTISEYGQIDILINNAGLSTEGRVEETSPRVFKTSFEVNVLGVLYPTQAAIPHLRKSKGQIIITGSIAGFMGLPEFSAYSGTKMALTAISQSLRIELAEAGVHVGLNYVGFVENDENKTYLNKEGEPEKLPVRSNFKRMPQAKVADIFLKGIAKRKKVQVLSTLGKATWLFSRSFPGLFEKIMISRYQKNQ
jgi:short-subunit dehydrogenase